MKTKSSSYVLAAEIITIILFHAVKIRQTEKHPADIVFNRTPKNLSIHQPVAKSAAASEYMLVNLVK